MSVANPSLTAPSRRISHTVRLAPYLVETLCELTRAVRDKTHVQTEITGLLFGTAGEEMTTVESLRSFEDTGPRSDLARRERLDKAFDNAMAQADEDPELAACRLVGWFSLRSSSGLLSSGRKSMVSRPVTPLNPAHRPGKAFLTARFPPLTGKI